MRTSPIPARRPRRQRRLVLGTVGAVAAGTLALFPAPSIAASPSPSSSSPAPTGQREAHVGNPYAGAKVYVNPEWRALAESEAGGARVSNTPTGVWIDKVAKIGGTAGAMGLRAHLDAALAQGANLVQIVLDDLPRRDCMLMGFDGDFTQGELARYRKEFVDPVVAIESDPRYGSLRIVNVLDPDAIPFLVVGVRDTSRYPAICRAQLNGNEYVEGLRSELNALHPYSNLYTYLDMAHHGVLGWDSNLTPAALLLLQTVKGTTAGPAALDGVATNVANYSPLKEPYFTATTTVNGYGVHQSKWVDWNPYIDEIPYAQALRARLVALGADPGIGVLIDTSRNGWGGPARPTGASTSTDLNTFVDRSRIDRRHQGDLWCNQVGAGLGERPVADPVPGVDAYVWMKPPGLSDGASTWSPASDDGTLDEMCDPTFTGHANMPHPTGAMADAPARGTWFPAQFRQLMSNAYPPLP